jgi:hypothetical protein
MHEAIITMVMQILGELILGAIGVASAWVLAKMAETKKLQNVAAATHEAQAAAEETVLELQQTVVDGLKAAAADGKLTDVEKCQLNALLMEKALAKISAPAKAVLEAAGKDVATIIRGAAEALIARIKMHN